MALTLAEYAKHDALGLAALIEKKDVTPKELAQTAARAIAAVNPEVNAVVETYADRIDGLDETSLGAGPFRGVPFLMKDVFGHEGGRKIEFGSRLCKGMVADQDTNYCRLVKAAGVNIIGRSAAPEYSMAGTTEGALYGNTSNPWKKGYSAGGSTGGGQAAVVSGMVPIAHGSDIAGSIRIPGAWCGGFGFKPSRGRISFGPALDENGFGLAMNFVQVKTVRDAAAMLDCLAIPQTGDPFLIPKPAEAYAKLARDKPPRLKIGWTVKPLVDVPVDAEIVSAVKQTAQVLSDMGHNVFERDPDMGGPERMRRFADVWFFGLDVRLAGFAAKSGHKISPETLEPITYLAYEHAKRMTAADFFAAVSAVNQTRRQLAKFYEGADIWLSPTIAKVAEPWGRYNLGRADVTMETLVRETLAVPCQYTVPHNIMGTPAMTMPLVQHSSGLPIGIQLGGKPAAEHVLLQLATALEAAMPWAGRVPALHASRA